MAIFSASVSQTNEPDKHAGGKSPRVNGVIGHLQLQPHVSFAIVDDRPVFLDLRRDRYLALEGSAQSGFGTLCRGCVPDTPTLARLLATGLFMEGPKPAELAPVRFPTAQKALPARPVQSLSLTEVVEIGFLLWRTRLALRSRPLEQLIESCRRRARQNSCGLASDASVTIASRFRRARAWVPIKPSCLQDSLALHRWLGRFGAGADLVIGVKLYPFAAHCWLQAGDILLNDAPETVAAFTPILTVQCN
jgi:hypothetical protein